jgi:hypothetical protein
MDCVVANGGTPATKPQLQTIDGRLTVVAAESSLTQSGVIDPVTRVLQAMKAARPGRETPRLLHLLRAVLGTHWERNAA